MSNLVRRQQGTRPQGNYRTHPLQLDETLKVSSTATTTALTDRLQELLVLEFHKNGSREYMHLTVRGLYRHVLNAITDRGTLAVRTAVRVSAVAQSWKKKASSSSSSSSSAQALVASPPPCDDAEPFDDSLLFDNGTEEEGVVDLEAANVTAMESSPPTPTIPKPTVIMQRHSSTDAMPLRYSNNNKTVRASLPTSAAKGTNGAGGAKLHTMSSPPPPPTTTAAITYRERLGAYLHPRDMRRLVTPFSTSNEPELIVRRHVMLLNFDPLRAIILRDRLLVLVPDGADSLITKLERRVRGGSSEIENSIFGDKGSSSASLHSGIGGGGGGATTTTGAATTMTHVPCEVVENNATTGSTSDSTTTTANTLRTGSATQILNVLLSHKPKQTGLGLRQLSELTEADPRNDAAAAGSGGRGPTDGEDRVDETSGLVQHDDLSRNGGGGGGGAAIHAGTAGHEGGDATLTLGEEEFEEMKDSQWANLSFELQCADAVLHEVGAILSQDTFELQEVANKYIHQVLHGHGFNDDPLTMIRTVKDAVQLMTNRVNGFVKSMNRILDDDEDMALMNLSRLVTHPERYIQPVPQRVLDEESDEPELILEANLHNSLTLLNYLDLVKGQINTAKELIDQKQDATRNRLLFANMMISIFSLCVTVAATVGSFFGMNVHNGYEVKDCSADGTCPPPSTHVFKIIVGVTLAACTFMCFLILGVLWFSGTIPRTRHKLSKDVKL
jgi:hypothetical protein